MSDRFKEFTPFRLIGSFFSFVLVVVLIRFCVCSPPEDKDEQTAPASTEKVEQGKPHPRLEPCDHNRHKRQAWSECWQSVSVHIPKRVLGITSARAWKERWQIQEHQTFFRTKHGTYLSTRVLSEKTDENWDPTVVKTTRIGPHEIQYEVTMPMKVVWPGGAVRLKRTYICYTRHWCKRRNYYKGLNTLLVRDDRGKVLVRNKPSWQERR